MRRIFLIFALLLTIGSSLGEAAIARDGAGVNGGANSGALTWSHTVNGPTPILWVAGRIDDLVATLSATFNGSSMTNPSGAKYIDVADGSQYYLFYIVGATGTHNIVLTPSVGTPTVIGFSMAFSGVDQSTPFDVAGNQQTSIGTTISDTLTTTVANAWMVAFARDFTAGPPAVAGGSVLDIGDGGSTGLYSQGPYGTPGSNSLQYTPSGVHVVDSVYAAFRPAGGAPACTPTIMLMGVGRCGDEQ